MLRDAVFLHQGSEAGRRLMGRLAAVLLLGSGVLGVVTLPLAPGDASRPATVAISAAAIALGTFAWRAPWQRWHPRASLWLIPPAFALIALGNRYGGAD